MSFDPPNSDNIKSCLATSEDDNSEKKKLTPSHCKFVTCLPQSRTSPGLVDMDADSAAEH